MKCEDNIFIIIISIIVLILIGCIAYLNTIKSPVKIPVEIRDVTVEDIQLLINRAKVLENLELEAILHAVAGALETKTLAELADYTTKYSKHMLEDHYKSDIILKKLNMI